MISIVITNINGKEILEKNLPSVMGAWEGKENSILEVIVVDDASTDESVAYLMSNFPKVRVVKHKVNRGFAAATNTGVRSARGDLVCLLNNDVSVEKDFLESIPSHFKNKKVFGVSLHEKSYGWAKGVFKDGFIMHEPGTEDTKVHQSFWVSGGSGVFRRNLWIELGGFDEKLFHPFYWEDLDLSYRAQKRGYHLLWDPAAYVYHNHESTIGRFSKSYVDKIRERNQLIFIWKNLTSLNLFRKHLAGLLVRIGRHPGYIRIVFMALSKLSSILKARMKERKEAKVSDEAIFARFR